MYIYFDRNGTIQEVINDESIRKGSNDYNKIYCYLEGNPDIDDIWYLQKNPDGTLTKEVSFVNKIVKKAIPYDSHRDMKYFQDFEEYQFYVFTLSSSYLLQSGLVVATIRVAENNTMWALGELTFNVQANIVKSDNDITQSQYDYLLLSYASRTLNEQTGSDLDDLLDKKIEAKANDIIEPIFDDYKATIDEEVENQNEKIESLGQLQPSGVDTSTNILAFTTNKGIYIGSDTGHWYYWNGTQYVDGGVYLSNEYPSKFEVDVLNNFTNQSFISGSSGQQAIYHYGLGSSEYINIIKNSIVTIYRDLAIIDDRGISFYDATKTPIQSFTYTSSNKQIFVAPDNAYYVRFTIEFDDYSEDLSTLHTRATIQYQPNDVGKAINFTRNEIDFSNTSEFKISNDIGLLTCFRKVGVIGDSLASGQCVDSNGVGHDLYEYSWGQYLARATNNTYYNFSKGGMTTGMWLTDSMGAPLAFDGNHDCQAYIIGLGVNDAYLQLPVGTINDIHLEDYTLNPDTFYGNYGRIIQMIKQYYPKAKIFLLTMPQHYEGHNACIRDIATLFNENVYLVDLYNLMGVYVMSNDGILCKCFRSGHYNAIGYYIISKMIASAINYIIHNNLDDFLKIEFINTNYD